MLDSSGAYHNVIWLIIDNNNITYIFKTNNTSRKVKVHWINGYFCVVVYIEPGKQMCGFKIVVKTENNEKNRKIRTPNMESNFGKYFLKIININIY